MKNKNLKPVAPLYTVIGSINNDSVLNVRVIALTKAKEKDSIWSYPSTGGTKHVSASDLNKVLPEMNPDSIYKYRGYCTNATISQLVEMVKSSHIGAGSQVAAEIIPVTVPAPAPVNKVKSEKTVTGRTFSKNEQQDVDAVAAVLAGQKEKFAVIYKRYYPIILQSYSLKLKFDRALAEDIASELFVKIYQSLHKYKVQYTFNSWITRVANNFLVDYIRKQKLETVSIDAGVSSDKMRNEDSDSVTLDIKDAGLNPEEKITAKERSSCIINAINSLDANLREAVKKYYFEEKSYVEIAEEMGMPLGTLKSLIFRAKEKIKLALVANKQSLEVVF
jgi:RNA polymerase sigma-70 factor (ECF subfamily)